MKTNRWSLHALALAASLLTATAGLAHEGKDHAQKDAPTVGLLVAPNEKDATWLAQARAAYPLKTCVVSGDEFGGAMGEAVDRIYRSEGQPDRLIRFCCKDCIKDFLKDPDGFLRKLERVAESKPDHARPHH